jgi:hypothetical protein
LNHAWGIVVDQALEFQSYEDYGGDGSEIVEEYTEASRSELFVALSLVHAGMDHLLKSRIASVSPFLLITSPPHEWPKKCDQRDTPFADFKMIDSHSLPRAYNAIVPDKLTVEFEQQIQELRRQRNRIIHTVPEGLTPEAHDVLTMILRSTHELLGPLSWIGMRMASLAASPVSTIQPDGDSSVINRELRQVIRLLNPAHIKKYLQIDKKRRLYTCPICMADCTEAEEDSDNYQVGVAQLTPESAGATTLRCVVCANDTEVTRTKCQVTGCPGDVLAPDYVDEEELRCMTCHGTAPSDT